MHTISFGLTVSAPSSGAGGVVLPHSPTPSHTPNQGLAAVRYFELFAALIQTKVT